MERKYSQKRILTWVLQIASLFIAILFIIARFFPTLALFQATISGQNLCYLLFSIWAWLLLIWIVTEAQRMAGVRFTKQNLLLLVIIIVVVLGFYAYSLMTRKFIYYWDYANYYRLQIDTAADFQVNGFFAAATGVIKRIWYYAYSSFINIFLAVPFAFTPQTPDWFVAACAVTILPMLYWVIAIFLKLMEQILQPMRGSFFFTAGIVLAGLFPLIHVSLVYGQPDLFGLILAFLIMILTIPLDYSKADTKRYLIIFSLTVMIIASRRWYIYWVIAYYACYGLATLVRLIQGKRWEQLKRFFKFVLLGCAVVGAALFPLIRAILRTNYSVSYSEYNVGGFPFELLNQAHFLGLGLLILLLAGFLWGVFRKQTRVWSILAVTDILLVILLFTRIQNMGFHHSLILVPAYLLLMLLCLAGISRIRRKLIFLLSAAVVLSFYATNAAVCAAMTSSTQTALFSYSPLKLPQRDDIDEIRAVNGWLLESCCETKTAYMIPHGEPYNPDVFRCVDMPDECVSNILPYGSAVLGTHTFPRGLLLADYVLTCDPFCNLSLAEKYNSAFFSEIPQKHFVEAARFDMGNGYTFIAYQRILPTDAEEILFYEQYFAAEDARFPDMFSGVLDELLAELSDGT